MAKYKTSDAQRRANSKWKKNNREKNRISSYKSSARTFVRHYADDEDIEELLGIYKNENPNSKK